MREQYTEMVNSSINEINSILFFSELELKEIHSEYYLLPKGNNRTIKVKLKSIVNQEYILNLESRVDIDLNVGDYDSVLTKCRTLIEEVLIYILERSNIEINSKGDIVQLYKSVKEELNIQQRKEFDKRINKLLSGVENIIKAIAEMRNINSDAHGRGKNRIKINKREAELAINSTKTICLYLLNVLEDQNNVLS